jgi:hypothetical protein
MGGKVSDIVAIVLTGYIILGLLRDKDTTSSFVIPSVRVTSTGSFDVAVAVNATILIPFGITLRISPACNITLRNVSPL